jgi:hypothetical protein
MSDPLRSADKAYYSARKPLSIQGTREGRKNPVPVPSYRHQGNDVTASSSKYYATPAPRQVAPVSSPVQADNPIVLTITDPTTLLAEVIQAFRAGATGVWVHGDADVIRPARVVIDAAVGRNALTRVQADTVTFVVNAPAPIAIPAGEPILIAPESDTAVISPEAPAVEPELIVESEPESEPEITVTPEAVVAVVDEADEFLSAPAPKRSTKKKIKKGESKAITEADVAAAFGVSDDSDD